MSLYEVHDPRFEPPGMPPEEPFEEERPEGRGCLFWGCLFSVIVLLLLMIAAVMGVYFATQYVLNNFTTDKPAVIEAVELPEERLAQIKARAEAFRQVVERANDSGAEGPAAALPDPEDFQFTITAEELNGLIHQEEDLRGRVFVRIQDGQLGGEVSLPADDLPGGKGRFFNASAEFEVSLRDGVLVVHIIDAQANGITMPQQLVDQFANENLAKDFNKDPEFRKVLDRFDSLEIVEDRIILRAKPPAAGTEDDAEVTGEIESFEDVEEPVETD